MQQIATLLYTHSKLVLSEGVRNAEKEALAQLCDRMQRNIVFYEGNDAIIASFAFFARMVDFFYN